MDCLSFIACSVQNYYSAFLTLNFLSIVSMVPNHSAVLLLM